MNARAELLPRSVIANVCRLRTAALDRMTEASAALAAAYEISNEAERIGDGACMSARFYADTGDDKAADRLFAERYDAEKAIAAYRKRLDRRVWTHLIDSCGMRALMDRKAADDLDKSLAGDVPEATEDNVRATLEQLMGDADLIFRRGLVNCFTALDRRFRSHDGFKIGSRIIFEWAFDRDHGSMTYGGTWRTIADVERVMAVLDGSAPDRGGLEGAVRGDRQGYRPQQSETEARYFKLRGFKNGNAHLWFSRDDLVEKANKLLAEHYGEVLGDAHDDGGSDRDDLFRSTAVSKDLAFYRSPDSVVECLTAGVGMTGKRILEPSAGDGAIALVAARAGGSVRAIEVDEARCDLLRARASRLSEGCVTVEQGNFLRVPAIANFDLVLMNPPFYGTHWMAHVRHAFDFLADGSILRAVLPASAEVNETPKHEAFRKWAKPFYDYGWRGGFEALPEGSFAESGTNIQTVILHLRKR